MTERTQIPVLTVLPVFSSVAAGVAHQWLRDERENQGERQLTDTEGDRQDVAEKARQRLTNSVYSIQTHTQMCAHSKCALINPYSWTAQTQPDWREPLWNNKATLGSVSSLWTLCASTTQALYISPIQSICSLLFHPLLWSLSLHVICVTVLFVLFSGYHKAAGKTRTVTNSCARCTQRRQWKFHNVAGIMAYCCN